MNIRQALGIEQSECVLIGSRAFKVHNSNSDYDIVIKKRDVPKKLLNDYELLNLADYFCYIPPLGNNELIRIKNFLVGGKSVNIDLIIIEESIYIDKYRNVVSDMQSIPARFLENKTIRVTIFEELLKKEGFKKQDSKL